MENMQLVPDAERRELWLEERRTCLTATDAAKVLGLSPWGGPIDVWLEKTGRDETERETTPAMLRGRRREALVLGYYEDENAVPLVRHDSYTLVRSPLAPLIACTPDARRSDNLIPVEAKTARWADPRMWGPTDTDEFPVHYAAQIMIQCFALSANEGHLPVEFGGEEYRQYWLRPASSQVEAMVERLLKWWEEHVVADVAPPASGSQGYSDWLKREYPRAEVKTVDAVELGIDLEGARFGALRAQVKELESLRDASANAIKQAMGDAAAIIGSSWSATWKNDRDSEKVDLTAAMESLRLLCVEKGLENDWRAVVRASTSTRSGSRKFLLRTTHE